MLPAASSIGDIEQKNPQEVASSSATVKLPTAVLWAPPPSLITIVTTLPDTEG